MNAKIGRPLKFTSPKELEAAIDKYLAKTDSSEYTVTGLALAIGTNRQVLVDYGERPEYSGIVNRAKCIIENSYELSLRKSGRTGDIFALKNFGWKDQQHIEKTGETTKRLIVTVQDDDDMGTALEDEY